MTIAAQDKNYRTVATKLTNHWLKRFEAVRKPEESKSKFLLAALKTEIIRRER